MRVCLLNPNWTFEGSIYFGCREPHLPLEFGYASALLNECGHDVMLVDAQLHRMEEPEVRAKVRGFSPDFTVITTAPSYLFWRCAPPELRVPMRLVGAIRDVAGEVVVVGPHASTTPTATLRKLGASFAVRGECEEAIAELANSDPERWRDVPGIVSLGTTEPSNGIRRAANMQELPPLSWPTDFLAKHQHHHHRFEREAVGPGAEVESSRGCPYACTFCAKDNFRTRFRQRPLETVLREIDGLIDSGVTYLYFVDEIFLPNRPLLEALVHRPVEFGVQLRIDLFEEDTLELLGRAGCVSIEAGVESVTEEGRSLLAKRCKKSTPELVSLLVAAKRHVPFVQANLLNATTDDRDSVRAFRSELISRGVWVNDPVPLFPYPGSPSYTERWGLPDDYAWERALNHYLRDFERFSDIQEGRPCHLSELEAHTGA